MSNPNSLLIVEDEEGIREMLESLIRTDPTLRVTAVADLESALRELDLWPYDVVILDLLVGGVSLDHPTEGILAIRARQSHIAIVVLSGHEEKRAACLAAGADEFIAKPKLMAEIGGAIKFAFDKRRLSEKIDRIIQSGSVTTTATPA